MRRSSTQASRGRAAIGTGTPITRIATTAIMPGIMADRGMLPGAAAIIALMTGNPTPSPARDISATAATVLIEAKFAARLTGSARSII